MLILLLVSSGRRPGGNGRRVAGPPGAARTFLASRVASGALDPGTRRLLFGALAVVGVTSGAFLGAVGGGTLGLLTSADAPSAAAHEDLAEAPSAHGAGSPSRCSSSSVSASSPQPPRGRGPSSGRRPAGGSTAGSTAGAPSPAGCPWPAAAAKARVAMCRARSAGSGAAIRGVVQQSAVVAAVGAAAVGGARGGSGAKGVRDATERGAAVAAKVGTGEVAIGNGIASANRRLASERSPREGPRGLTDFGRLGTAGGPRADGGTGDCRRPPAIRGRIEPARFLAIESELPVRTAISASETAEKADD